MRLVVAGVGFTKELSKETQQENVKIKPPKVYIELVPIIPVLHKITLGPKVERAGEWAATFNYFIKQKSEKNENPNDNVEIVISHLPFK